MIELRAHSAQPPGMSIDEKIACAINVVFGAAVGFGFYAIGLGGLWWLISSRNPHWWNGWIAFFLCVGGGGFIGYRMYTNRLDEIDLPSRGELTEGMYAGEAGQELLWKRIGAIAGGLIALYFIWRMARSV
ncbi:MAG TPA: hypothetical protein VI282_20385 [Verrucomicrobiae bacterium]|jgi:hypothetical protein